MSNLAKLWDFIWGTLIVGMLPMFAFVLVMMLGGLVTSRPQVGVIQKCFAALWFAASLVVPFATLYFVARWRQKHRLLPASLLVAEILLGLLLAGVAFVFTVFFWGMASLE